MQLSRGDVRRARGAVGEVLVLLVLLLFVYVIAVLTVPGQWLDDEIFGLVQRLGVGPLAHWLPVASRVLLPDSSSAAPSCWPWWLWPVGSGQVRPQRSSCSPGPW